MVTKEFDLLFQDQALLAGEGEPGGRRGDLLKRPHQQLLMVHRPRGCYSMSTKS